MDRIQLASDAAARLHCRVEPVTAENPLTGQEARSVPAWWPELAGLDAAGSTDQILAQWNSALPDTLPQFYNILTQRGQTSLVRIDAEQYNGIAILYAVARPGTDTIYLTGYPPVASPSGLISELPDSVQSFYTTIHDGLLDGIGGELAGIVRAHDLIDWESWLGESELEYVSDPPQNPPLAKNLIMFYSDGAGGNICIDKDPRDTAVWAAGDGMFSDRSYQSASFWGVVDNWVALLLEP